MLLSFFIILNAISSTEINKAQPVLNSIAVAFTKEENTEIVNPGLVDRPATMTQDASTLDRIQSLFESHITTLDIKQNRLGTLMFVRLPFKDFHDAVISSIGLVSQNAPPASGGLQMDMMPTLLSLMESQRNVTYAMDMIIETEQNPAEMLNAAPEEFTRANKSITSIAYKLERAGLPKFQMTAGLHQGEPGMMQLVFRKYKPFSPVDPTKSTTLNDSNSRPGR